MYSLMTQSYRKRTYNVTLRCVRILASCAPYLTTLRYNPMWPHFSSFITIVSPIQCSLFCLDMLSCFVWVCYHVLFGYVIMFCLGMLSCFVWVCYHVLFGYVIMFCLGMFSFCLGMLSCFVWICYHV
jgi:hypothetical protein